MSALGLICGPASIDAVNQKNPSALFETPTTNLGSFQDQRCPAGQVAIGAHGRSGTRLDALGLICAPPRLSERVTSTLPGPAKVLGRTRSGVPSSAATDICATARMARARNNPAAPGLEARCRAITIARYIEGSATTEVRPGSVTRAYKAQQPPPAQTVADPEPVPDEPRPEGER